MRKLRELSSQILSPINRDEILNKLFVDLADLGFDSIMLFLKGPCGPLFRIMRSTGGDHGEFELGIDSILLMQLRKEKGTVRRFEISRMTLSSDESKKLAGELDMLSADICFPLFSKSNVKALFGVVCLGKSKLGSVAYGVRNIF